MGNAKLAEKVVMLRPQGCLAGQRVRDVVQSRVEFLSPSEIRTYFPKSMRELQGGRGIETNGTFTGAFRSANYGLMAVPEPWVRTVLSHRPEEGRPGGKRPQE